MPSLPPRSSREKLETRIADIGSKLAKTAGGTAMAEADPQASVLAKISGLDISTVQTALTIFVALLIEVGSGFGMYVAFAYWRLHDRKAEPVASPRRRPPRRAIRPCGRDEVATPVLPMPSAAEQAAPPQPAPRLGANDNRSPARPLVPESDVQRYYRERVVAAAEHASLTSSELYEDYCRWCEEKEHIPFAHPRVYARDRRARRQEGADRKTHEILRHRLAIGDRSRGGQEAADTLAKSSIGRKANWEGAASAALFLSGPPLPALRGERATWSANDSAALLVYRLAIRCADRRPMRRPRMPQMPPATVGMPLAQVDTPALIIDLDAFERNLAAHGRLRAQGRRAPAAACQDAQVARSSRARQMALGAVGVCCQKVSEAEVMVAGGIGDVLVSNEVAGAAKLDRLAALARRAKIGVCVDDADNVAELEAAAAKAGRQARRAGGDRRRRAALRRRSRRAGGAASPGWSPARRHLRFAGLQAYHGSAQHVREAADAQGADRARAWSTSKETLRALQAVGLEAATVAGARHRHLRERGGERASTPSCRPAPTSSWTPTTPATSAPTAARSTPSSTRCSSTPRS